MVGIEGTSGSLTGTTHRAEVTAQNELVTRTNFNISNKKKVGLKFINLCKLLLFYQSLGYLSHSPLDSTQLLFELYLT